MRAHLIPKSLSKTLRGQWANWVKRPRSCHKAAAHGPRGAPGPGEPPGPQDRQPGKQGCTGISPSPLTCPATSRPPPLAPRTARTAAPTFNQVQGTGKDWFPVKGKHSKYFGLNSACASCCGLQARRGLHGAN